ncbi:hypothetical protein [Verrucomicrobium spinosum]|nr:hypothetical protein [Verrucomicrobium spinosum]
MNAITELLHTLARQRAQLTIVTPDARTELEQAIHRQEQLLDQLCLEC